MKLTAPTRAELVAYALDEASHEVAHRVRLYLLLAGDRSAVHFVAELAEARVRVRALQHSAGKVSWIRCILAKLGWNEDLDAESLVPAWHPAVATMAGAAPMGHLDLVADPARPWQAVVAVTPSGAQEVLFAGDVEASKVPVPVPTSTSAIVVVSAAKPLDGKDAQKLLAEAARRQAEAQVSVSVLVLADEETP
jgi:hypothetical protein